MNKAEDKWTEIPLGDVPVEDSIWWKYDYLWVKIGNSIYLSRDQGESFTKMRWWTFYVTNARQVLTDYVSRTRQILTDLFQKWVK